MKNMEDKHKNGRQYHLKTKKNNDNPENMEDDLNKNGRRPKEENVRQPQNNVRGPQKKMEDDLKKIKWKTTSKKNYWRLKKTGRQPQKKLKTNSNKKWNTT
jgi:hypothetical protein